MSSAHPPVPRTRPGSIPWWRSGGRCRIDRTRTGRTGARPMPDAPVPAAVFDDLVGQQLAVDELSLAVAASHGDPGVPGAAMTHAWLFTGPAGSGRSVAARAFAAALQCPLRGCGHCTHCRTVLAHTHPDVRAVVPEGLTISVKEMRAVVQLAARGPAAGRYQVVLIEDADRLTEGASNALLKAVEEPAPRTVFLLCAPSTHPDDVSVTIRSRCRLISLRTPTTTAIAGVLVSRDGTPADVAAWAAAAAQGHVGRARRLARDPQSRARREAVLSVPRRLTGIGACYDVAATVIEAADAEADANTVELDARERAE